MEIDSGRINVTEICNAVRDRLRQAANDDLTHVIRESIRVQMTGKTTTQTYTKID